MADLTVTAASVLWTSGSKISGIAGASVTAGQALYLDSTTSTLKLAQADGTTAEAAAVGIALHAAGTGQPLVYADQGSIINIGRRQPRRRPTWSARLPAGLRRRLTWLAPTRSHVSATPLMRLARLWWTSGPLEWRLRKRASTAH
jgi:hypothetical protein